MVLAKKPAPPSSPSRTAVARVVAAASESVAIACGSLRRDTIESRILWSSTKKSLPPNPSQAVAIELGRDGESNIVAIVRRELDHPCRWSLSPEERSLGSDHGSFMLDFVFLGVGATFIDKDAPLEDEEIEVAEDDASLVKQIGQSFQYSKIEARREEQIQAAHDKAMFGASALPPPTSTDSELERENEKEVDKKAVVTSLLSETVSGFTADLCG
ncbi:hypothetical protein HN51_012823 [Arachis hypogaea]